MKLKLVENWKDCWRWISMNSMIVAMAMLGGWQALPDDLKASVPPAVVMVVAVVVLAFGAAGRLVQQRPSE